MSEISFVSVKGPKGPFTGIKSNMNLDESLENKIALITIKIRTIDKEFPIEIKNDETIKALKEKIETVRKNNLLI